MAIPTIVVEDEEKSLHVIVELIRQFTTDIELVGSAGYVDKSAQLIADSLPELVFMDIQLADGTGFDVLRKVSARDFELIFLTAHDGYAVDAFRVSAIDYLMKPVGIPEFEEAVGRAKGRIDEKKKYRRIDHLLDSLEHSRQQDRKIAVPTVGGCEFVELTDILWCTSEGSYTQFYLLGGRRVVSSRNLGFYESLLCAHNFYRIHNSSIINLRFIKSYVKGKCSLVVLTDGTQLEISQRRKADFLERFFPEKPV